MFLLLLVGFDFCLPVFLWLDSVAETSDSVKVLVPPSFFIPVLDYDCAFSTSIFIGWLLQVTSGVQMGLSLFVPLLLLKLLYAAL
jgi:hypothetical protein